MFQLGKFFFFIIESALTNNNIYKFINRIFKAKISKVKKKNHICVNPSSVDNAFLVSLVGMRPEKHFWIGLSNQKNIGKFVWTNTDSVRFTNWNSLMPGIEHF